MSGREEQGVCRVGCRPLSGLSGPQGTEGTAGGFFQTFPADSIPVCNLTPLLPPTPTKQAQSPQLNKPVMEVTGSLLGRAGHQAGVCSKDLVKKIEISQFSSAWNFQKMHLNSRGLSWVVLGLLELDFLNLPVTLILRDVGKAQ